MSPAEKDPDCREVIDLTMSYIFTHAKMEDGGGVHTSFVLDQLKKETCKNENVKIMIIYLDTNVEQYIHQQQWCQA